MLVILVVNVLNIAGNYAFIFGELGAPKLGVNGAAISTVVSRSIAMAVLFVIVFRTTVSRFPTHIFRRFPVQEFRNLMKIGLPSAGEATKLFYATACDCVFHHEPGYGGACCAYILRQHNNVRLSVLHIHFSRRGDFHRASRGAEKWHGAYVLGRFLLRVAVSITLGFSLCLPSAAHGL